MRHRIRLVAKEFNIEIDQATSGAPRPLEVLKLLTHQDRTRRRPLNHDPRRSAQNVRDVPDEEQRKEGKVCGCLDKAMYGTGQAASAWQEEVASGDARSEHVSKSVVTACFPSR